MRRCRYQLGAADLREACLHLRMIERRVVGGTGLTAGATNKHRAHTGCSIACCTASAFSRLVVRMSMDGQQAMRTCSGVRIGSEHFGLRSDIAYGLARNEIVRT